MAIGLVARYPDGSPHSDLLSVGAFASLFIDDGTGFVSASTPSAQKIAASPLKVGRKFHVTCDVAENTASVTGQFTIARQGDYVIDAHGDCLSGNSAVVVIEVFKTPVSTGVAAVISSSAANPGGAIKADLKMAGTAVKMGWALNGLLSNLKVGDLIDVRVTSDVGTVTIKQYQCLLRQLSDGLPPNPA